MGGGKTRPPYTDLMGESTHFAAHACWYQPTLVPARDSNNQALMKRLVGSGCAVINGPHFDETIACSAASTEGKEGGNSASMMVVRTRGVFG